MIARELRLSRETVRKYARAAVAPTPQPRAKRSSLLDPYKPYLIERGNGGCHVGTELLREIQKQGYQGSRSIVLDFVAAIRRQQGIGPKLAKLLPAAIWHRYHGWNCFSCEFFRPFSSLMTKG